MKLHTGTIISGTLKSSDLLNAFANTLALHDHHNNKQLIEEALHLSALLESAKNVTDFEVEWLNMIMDDLSNKLQELCPVGYYFGTHPGDGSDFGVWKENEDEYKEMMTGYEQWLDDEESRADCLHQFMKEQE